VEMGHPLFPAWNNPAHQNVRGGKNGSDTTNVHSTYDLFF